MGTDTHGAEPELQISNRKLPHWRLEGSTYFVTWRLKTGQHPLSDAERNLITTALKYFNNERYKLLAWVVMPDHVHTVFEPLAGVALSQILHSWKSFTSNQLTKHHGRTAPVWQIESYDRIIRDENELFEKIYYVITNPERRWEGVQDYKWVGWYGQQDIVAE